MRHLLCVKHLDGKGYKKKTWFLPPGQQWETQTPQCSSRPQKVRVMEALLKVTGPEPRTGYSKLEMILAPLIGGWQLKSS